jgi:hypothetical protein
MSSPLGVEALPAEQARPLLDAWHEGVGELDARHSLSYAEELRPLEAA